MSPKKKRPKRVPSESEGKKRSGKKKIAKGTRRKLPEAKLQRKILPFTAAKLPSVSKTMPNAASAVPLVSKEIPLVSKTIPQFSAISNETIPKQWGKLPSKKWGSSKIKPTRKRKVKRPKDISVFNFLGKVITAPYQPVEMVKALTSAIHAQAEEETDSKALLEQKLIELKMRREMNNISEENYKIQEAKLRRRIKNLEEKAKGKIKKVKAKPKTKTKPKRKRG